jgi:tetratricopeptide (TPR) repeat protein
MESFEQAALAEPASFAAEDWSARGDNLYRSGKFAEALPLYDRAIATDSGFVWAWRGKGLTLINDPTRLAESLECFERAVQLKPDNAWLRVDQGNVYYAQKKYSQALECYEKAIELDSKYVGAWVNVAVTRAVLENYEGAIQAYDKALEIDPSYADALLGKGACLTDLKKYEESIPYFDRVIELKPDLMWGYNNKGYALSQRGKHDEALALFNRALELDSREGLPWMNKAINLMALGREEEATACVQQGLSAIRERVVGLQVCAKFYSDFKFDHLKALEYYQEAFSLKPDDPDVSTDMAECLVKLGRYSEARELAIKLDSASLSAMRRCVMRFLVLACYGLGGDVSARAREMHVFLERYRAWQEKLRRSGVWTWNFNGLLDAIRKSPADSETKFLLYALIDLQTGKSVLPSFEQFQLAEPDKEMSVASQPAE